MNDKSILFLITSGFPYGNGEPFLENEIDYLIKRFNKLVIISHNTGSQYKRKINDNVDIYRLSYEISKKEKLISLNSVFKKLFWEEIKHIRYSLNISLSLGIIKTLFISLYNAEKLRKNYSSIILKYDLYHRHYCYSYWANDSSLALAILKNQNDNIKCLSRIHGWDVYFEPSKYNYLPFRKFIADNLDSIFSISKKGMDYCIDNWKINNSAKIKLSRLGVQKQFCLKQLSDDYLLVSCSNLIPLKRIDLLIKSLALIKFKIKWVHFGDGIMFDNLIRLSKEILPNNVSFQFKGRVENKLVLEYYQDNKPNLFINLSSSEGIPVSIMEAMSFGITVMATNVGGNSEIVNYQNGYLIDSNPTAKDVAKTITQFFKLSSKEKNIKRNLAFQTCNDNYNANKNYTQFVEYILSL